VSPLASTTGDRRRNGRRYGKDQIQNPEHSQYLAVVPEHQDPNQGKIKAKIARKPKVTARRAAPVKWWGRSVMYYAE